MILSGEGGAVQFYDLKTGDLCHEFETNSMRVKGMKLCKSDQNDNKHLFFTGSSDGVLKAWEVEKRGVRFPIFFKEKLKGRFLRSFFVCIQSEIAVQEKASIDTKFRILSLAVSSIPPSQAPQTGAQKQQLQDAEEEMDTESSEASDTGKSDSESEDVESQPAAKKRKIEVETTTLTAKQRRRILKRKEKQKAFLAAKKQTKKGTSGL